MELKKFLGISIAVQYAAQFASRWRISDGSTADYDKLLEDAEFADGEGDYNDEDEADFDPESANSYVVVDQTGAIGFYYRKTNSIEWYAKPISPAYPAAGAGYFAPQYVPPAPAPARAPAWTCACGGVNQGRFCRYCGRQKPCTAPRYRCSTCGWTPDDPSRPPRFCRICGDPFNSGDLMP